MRTNRDMRLSTAIRLAMGTSLAATMVVGPVANAAEEEDAAELERVQVTGSRISRLDIEGATPVVTISREDLDNSGFQSVADFLRSNSFNSFGSFRESSGNTFQGQAQLNLRGIGSNRTLILLDGRRLPGSPVMDGQIQNLNTVPFAAVERIEILSDGASAVYGSDAIGGVVNIILRKDFEGGEISVRGTSPDRDGGEERGVSIVNGFGGDRGRVTFALEADYQGTILNRDRWFDRNQFLGGDPEDVNNYTALSFYGRNIINYADPNWTEDVQARDADGNLVFDDDGNPVLFREAGEGDYSALSMIDGPNGCGLYGEGFWQTNLIDSNYPPLSAADAADAGGHIAEAYPNGVPGDYGCYYDYTGVAATTAELNRLSAFMDAEYEINSDLIFSTQIVASRVDSWGRYAPAAAPVTWSGDDLEEETITYNGEQYTLNEVNAGDVIYMRWNNTGPARDTWQIDTQYDFQVGLDGYHGGVQWNVNYQYDLYDMQEWGDGYIHNLGVARAAELGWDPRHPNQQQYAAPEYNNALGHIAGNSNRRAQMEFQRVDVGAQFDGPMMGAGPMVFFVGGEYVDQEYYDQTLAQMEALNIGGTAGGSSGGSRSNWAVFSEASIPVTDVFELNPAVRYDSYSDFGTNVSGKLSFRFQPVEYFLLRGSFGTGFRAPSLDELYQAPSQSFAFADDLVQCDAAGTALVDCIAATDQQYETYFGNNPDLDAETSTQYLLGAVLDFNQMNGTNLVLSLDYYYTEIEDVITTISSMDAFWLEYLEQIDQYEGVSVDRLANGRHNISTVRPINYSSFDTSGLDFRASYGLPLGGLGDLSFGLQATYVMEYNTSDILVGPAVDITGRAGVPDWRADLDVAWTLGRHTVSLNSFFIPSTAESSTLNPDFEGGNESTYYRVPTGSLDSYAHHNIVYSFEAPWDARIQFGVNNVTDEDPPLNSAQEYDLTLYPLVSRAYVASYTQRF